DWSQKVAAELGKPMNLSFANETPLDDVIKYVRKATTSPTFPDGIPIYVDPLGLQEAERSLNSTVTIDVAQVPLRTSLKLLLKQPGLTYRVRDGLLTITSIESTERPEDEGSDRAGPTGGMGGGTELTLEPAQTSGGARLNQEAASDQAAELCVADGQGS